MDLDALLAPLETGDLGAGADLREDFSATSLYQRLRDARSGARAEERARDADGEVDAPEAAGWQAVLALGEDALAAQSKDLEIGCWMTEALVRREGLAGLALGARLLAGLCERYWDALYPRPDEEGLEGRRSPLEGLSGSGADGTVMQPLRRLPLFRRADGSPFGLYQWEQAEQVAALEEEKRQARYDAGAPELRTLEAEARLDRAYLIGSGRALGEAVLAWQALEAAADAAFGAEAPSLRKVRELLARMQEVVVRLGGVEQADDAAPTAETVGEGTGDGTGAGAPTGAMTRESALRDLDRIAEFFRRTEPHSPLSYTLEEAVRRGRMGFAELLAEVLPDNDARNALLMRLGIRPGEG
jgi:type VI secretion system protein ImpA